MPRLKWDKTGEHIYETGVDHGVLYLLKNGLYRNGVVWNGLTSVTESPSGADEQSFYADNIKYISLRGAEDFGATIECYTYPPEWEECDGRKVPIKGVSLGQQRRKHFGVSFRTAIGDDEEDATDIDNGYKIHMIYNATASVSDRQYQTINDSPEPINFSYEIATTPVPVESLKDTRPVSLIVVNSREVDVNKLAALEDKLYGTEPVAADYTVDTAAQDDNKFDPDKVYYEKKADGTYEPTTDEDPDTTKTDLTNYDKTYYVIGKEGSEGNDPYLPLPDEVLATLGLDSI